MPTAQYRDLHPSREAEEVFNRWLDYLDAEFTKHKKAELRAELVRDQLHQLFLGRPHGGRLNFTLNSELAFNVLQLSLDSANVTLGSEYDCEIDEALYSERKPLIWFWQMFDRSPVGLNHWLGFSMRSMLSRHIFKHVGKNVRFYPGIEIRFGYNLTIEDDVVIKEYAILNDCRPITLNKGTEVPEYAQVEACGNGSAQIIRREGKAESNGASSHS
jgi:hypothetical protein